MLLIFLLTTGLIAGQVSSIEHLIQQGLYRQAKKELDVQSMRFLEPKLLISHHERLNHWLLLGKVMTLMGRHNQAKSAFQRAFFIAPNVAMPVDLPTRGKESWLNAKAAKDNISSYQLVVLRMCIFDHYVDGVDQRIGFIKNGRHFFKSAFAMAEYSQS